jgi:uncharacterized lipoprotein YmbA
MKRFNRIMPFAQVSLVVAALLLMSGCVPHRIQYYQLSAIVKPVAPPETGPVLLVGRIATPLALQDGRIRYRPWALMSTTAGPTRLELW